MTFHTGDHVGVLDERGDGHQQGLPVFLQELRCHRVIRPLDSQSGMCGFPLAKLDGHVAWPYRGDDGTEVAAGEERAEAGPSLSLGEEEEFSEAGGDPSEEEDDGRVRVRPHEVLYRRCEVPTWDRVILNNEEMRAIRDLIETGQVSVPRVRRIRLVRDDLDR